MCLFPRQFGFNLLTQLPLLESLLIQGVPAEICNDHGLIILAGGNTGGVGLGGARDGKRDTINEEVWTSVNGTVWTLDFSNETDHYEYVRAESPLSYLQTIMDHEISVIVDDHGIDDQIQALANIDRGTVLTLKTGHEEPDFFLGPEAWRGGPMRFVCPQKLRAINIVSQCAVKPEIIDGEEEMAGGKVSGLICCLNLLQTDFKINKHSPVPGETINNFLRFSSLIQSQENSRLKKTKKQA